MNPSLMETCPVLVTWPAILYCPRLTNGPNSDWSDARSIWPLYWICSKFAAGADLGEGGRDVQPFETGASLLIGGQPHRGLHRFAESSPFRCSPCPANPAICVSATRVARPPSVIVLMVPVARPPVISMPLLHADGVGHLGQHGSQVDVELALQIVGRAALQQLRHGLNGRGEAARGRERGPVRLDVQLVDVDDLVGSRQAGLGVQLRGLQAVALEGLSG